MALVIKNTPPAYSSINDDLVYTVLDAVTVADPVTYPNFKYIGDVYVNGVQIARMKKIADPVTGIGVFNIGQAIRSYVSVVFNPAPGILSQTLGQGAFNLSIQMKFGEEYSYTDYLNMNVDSARVFFNNYNGRLKGQTSSLVPLVNSIASNQPKTSWLLFSSQYFFVPYFPTSLSAIPVSITPTGGGAFYSTTINPINAYDLQVFNLAPQSINAVSPGVLTPNTTSYVVVIGSQSFTVNIICEAQYTPYMVHFMNQYGGFDSKLFHKVSRTSYDIVKADYGKIGYSVDASGNVTYKSVNGVYNERKSVYSTQYTEKLVLNTNFLSDAEYVWLADLVFSPMVFIEDGGYIYPVTLSDTTYDVIKRVNDDISSLTLNVEFGTTNNTQFR